MKSTLRNPSFDTICLRPKRYCSYLIGMTPSYLAHKASAQYEELLGETAFLRACRFTPAGGKLSTPMPSGMVGI